MSFVAQVIGWWVIAAMAFGIAWIWFVHLHNKWRARRTTDTIVFSNDFRVVVDLNSPVAWDDITVTFTPVDTDAVMMMPGQHHSVPIPKECFPEADRKVLEDLEAP